MAMGYHTSKRGDERVCCYLVQNHYCNTCCFSFMFSCNSTILLLVKPPKAIRVVKYRVRFKKRN